MNPFKYPELTTIILQYLPTKQIINLYCNSNIIAAGIHLSSHIMYADLFYNSKADYTRFPTHQFVVCINKYMKDDDFIHLKNNQLNKFANIKFVCNLLGHYCIRKSDRNEPYFKVNEKMINFLKQFNIIDPCWDLNYACDIFNIIYDLYYSDGTTPYNHSGISNICIDKPTNLNKYYNPKYVNPKQSLYLNNCRDYTISNNTVNHLILDNCHGINVDAKIKGNVVLDNCMYIKINQDYVNKITLKKSALKCYFNSVGTLDASDCGFMHTALTKHDSKIIRAKSVNHLIIDKFRTNYVDFGKITSLSYKAPLRSYYCYDEYRYDTDTDDEDNECSMKRSNVTNYSRNDGSKARMNNLNDVKFYGKYNIIMRENTIDDYDYSFDPNDKKHNERMVINDNIFNKLMQTNTIKHLSVYIRNYLVIDGYKHLETLTVDCIEQYVHDDYIDPNSDDVNDLQHRLEYDEYDLPKDYDDFYGDFNSFMRSSKVQDKSVHIYDNDIKEYYAIIGKQKLIVNNCPMLKELNVICTTKYINYEVYGCDNLQNINIKYPNHYYKNNDNVKVNISYSK